METHTIIVDNFYSDPDEVRKMALGMEFDEFGNFPGSRTGTYYNQSILDTLGVALGRPITHLYDHFGTFQLTYCHELSWVHNDKFAEYAAIIYLTPDAPTSAGTGFYEHRETGLRHAPLDINDEASKREGSTVVSHSDLAVRLDEEGGDITKWKQIDVVANIYNRLLIYKGSLFHRSLDYFGTKPDNARLFQVFFFDIII